MRFSLPFTLPSSLLSDEARQRLNHPWVIVGALLAVPLLATALYVTLLRSERQAQARELSLRTQVKDRLRQLAASPAGDVAPYPERLPVSPYPVARAIEHLRAAAESQTVSVASVSANERPATSATLGRVTLDFTLRGGYVAIKAVLNELLSRDAQRVVLQQFSLRRSTANPALGTATGDVEAQVSVSWLHRPLSAVGAAVAPTARAASAPSDALAAATSPASASASASAASSAPAPIAASAPASKIATTPQAKRPIPAPLSSSGPARN